MAKEQKDLRLKKIAKEADGPVSTTVREIYADTQTGVQYLIVNTGTGVAVTPLLGRDGKPLVEDNL